MGPILAASTEIAVEFSNNGRKYYPVFGTFNLLAGFFASANPLTIAAKLAFPPLFPDLRSGLTARDSQRCIFHPPIIKPADI